MERFVFDNRTRSYRVHVPPSYRPEPPMPLVLVLHGGGGGGETMARLSHMSRTADQYGFIAVYPDGISNRWADGRGTTPPDRMGVDDVGFLNAVVDEVSDRFAVDADRIYATGISNGGFMAHRLACDLSERIAAIAAVAAPLPEAIAQRCHPEQPISVLLISGTEDPLAPYQGGLLVGPYGAPGLSAEATALTWAEQLGCDVSPAWTEVSDGAGGGMEIRKLEYAGCKEGFDVVLYAIEGGGHTWPGGIQYMPVRMIGPTCRNLDASDLIWRFFAAHPKV